MSEQYDNTRARIWYLPGPFYRYNEDVKRLARLNDCKIIDATVTDSRFNAIEGPRVTLKPEYGGDAPTAAPLFFDRALDNTLPTIAAQARPVPVEDLSGPTPAAPLGDSPPPGLPQQALAEQLRAAEVLVGSDKLPASLELGSGADNVQAGTVVAAAHKRSGKDVAEWNALKPAARNKLVLAEVEIMRNEAAEALARTLTN